jgi:glycosyltransferase involved in cell wall biosynthesis
MKAAQHDERILLKLGPVPEDRVTELFDAADTAVFTRGDGWTSGSLILAMSIGIAVIAAKRAAYADLMNGEGAGWFFEPGSVSSLAESLSAAAADRETTRLKGVVAHDLANRMSWATSAAMLAPLVAPSVSAKASEIVVPMASAVTRA